MTRMQIVLVLMLFLVSWFGLGSRIALAVPPAVEAKSEFLLADKLFNEGKFDEAIEHAEKSRGILGTSNSRIEYLLAVSNFKVASFDKALAATETFFSLTPESESSSTQYNEMVALYAQIKSAGKQLSIEMVPVPGGCFQMGDIFDDLMPSDLPVHEVCVDSFLIGKYEVTQGQWWAVLGNNPSHFTNGDNYPVESITWQDAQKFINKLNEISGKKYRLPTEAEWEYAARSGGKPERYSGGNNLDEVGWHEANSGASTHSVGKKRANGLGIYDMSGNVSEWCNDWYKKEYYKDSPRLNPTGAVYGTLHSVRGGDWSGQGDLKTSARGFGDTAYPGLGLRLLLQAK